MNRKTADRSIASAPRARRSFCLSVCLSCLPSDGTHTHAHARLFVGGKNYENDENLGSPSPPAPLHPTSLLFPILHPPLSNYPIAELVVLLLIELCSSSPPTASLSDASTHTTEDCAWVAPFCLLLLLSCCLLLAAPCVLLLLLLLYSRALRHAAHLHLLPSLSCYLQFLHGCACTFATSWLHVLLCYAFSALRCLPLR